MLSRVLITPHQGLGDHILCNGIYREIAKTSRKTYITVKKKYASELAYMLRDCPNVKLVVLPNRRSWTSTRVTQIFARIFRIRVVGLGSYGNAFFVDKTRFDANFYRQANLDFDFRWKSFYVERNTEKENEIFEKLECGKQPYLFLHEDILRNYKIDRNRITSDLRIIEPNLDPNRHSIFDYRKVIEFASEIHVIESSFAALIESMMLDAPLFAHRYSRGHALYDVRHEFSYKKGWKILL